MSKPPLRLWAVFGFVVCLAVVLYAVLRPDAPPYFFRHSDKAGHVLGFFALCVSARVAFPRIPFWLFWPFFVAMAPFLEWLQHVLQTTRVYSANDTRANAAGVLVALICWLAYLGFRRIRAGRGS